MMDTLQKWVGPIITMLVLGASFIVGWTNVRGEQTRQGTELAEIKTDAKSDRKAISEMDKTLTLLKDDVGDLKEDVARQQKTLDEILIELRKGSP